MVQALTSKPTILWVNGSFTPASYYATMAENVRSQGYEIVVDTLPSSARTPPEQPATMTEDADFFHDIAEKLADQGKDIVLVMHSYGGVPGTECSKGLSKADRQEAGKPGGIIRLVYLTCVVPDVGVPMKESVPPLPFIIGREDGFMEHIPEESAPYTLSDLPREEGIEWVRKMPLHSQVSFEGKLTYPGYKYIPSSWILCERDELLPPDFQRNCIELIEKQSGKKVDVYNFDAAHCPNISAPKELADIVIQAVAAA